MIRIWYNRVPCTHRLIFLLFLCLVFLLNGCAPKGMQSVAPHKTPLFRDDLPASTLQQAVDRSIHYLQKLPPDRLVVYGEKSYPVSRMVQSLQTFQDLLRSDTSAEELQKKLTTSFDVYKATGSRNIFHWGRLLVTGYYEPMLEGSLVKKPPFLYPLYSLPPDLLTRDDKNGDKKVGRLEDNTFLPYWTRAEIENENRLAGHELVYLADPVEAFILHVQGSGKIRLPDSTLRRVHYAGANGHPYRSIGKLLVDEGIMPLEEVNLPRIRQFLAENPAERDRILHHNESFIFFEWQDTEGAIGSIGEVLTPGRSVAADHSFFPAGALGFLQTEKPLQNRDGDAHDWTAMSRFVLVQDSGSAIKGTGRLDLFWGNGDYAETAAGSMKHDGDLFFLLLKDANEFH